MVDPVVTGALIWLVQRLLDKGIDRIFDATFDTRKQAPLQPAVAPMVAGRRHDLTADGAQGTSDVDIGVRYHAQTGRAPVILTFQKFGTKSGGATFPMVLGDTAHLTLRRDHYLIAALVVDLPRTAGALPTLRGIGWTQEWVADNHVRKVAITTRHPTEALVQEVGLTKSDGRCPFILAPAPATPAAPRIADWPASNRQWRQPAEETPFRTRWRTTDATPPRPLSSKPSVSPSWPGVSPSKPSVSPSWPSVSPAKPSVSPSWPSASPSSAVTCRARTGVPNERCGSSVHADKLCLEHWQHVRNGHPVHDYQTGERLWTS